MVFTHSVGDIIVVIAVLFIFVMNVCLLGLITFIWFDNKIMKFKKWWIAFFYKERGKQ